MHFEYVWFLSHDHLLEGDCSPELTRSRITSKHVQLHIDVSPQWLDPSSHSLCEAATMTFEDRGSEGGQRHM